MSEEISREEIAALLARGSEEMPREEAKVKNFDILRFIADNAGLSMFEAIEKAYNMGLSEQEPCENAISRMAAIDTIESWLSCDDYNNAERHIMRATKSMLYDLPPVKPQEPKTGHWIEQEGFDGDTYYDCSECGESFCLIDGTPTDNLYNYCPNCGAKMVEPHESEDVENDQ